MPNPGEEETDDLFFDQEDFYPADEFAEQEETVPPKRVAQSPPPSEPVPPKSARRNTWILAGSAVFFICLAVFWVLSTSGTNQKPARNADNLLPPVNQMQGQGNTGFLVNNLTGQQPEPATQQRSQDPNSLKQRSSYPSASQQTVYNTAPQDSTSYAQGQHINPGQPTQGLNVQEQRGYPQGQDLQTQPFQGQPLQQNSGYPAEQSLQINTPPIGNQATAPKTEMQTELNTLIEHIKALTVSQEALHKEFKTSNMIKPVENTKLTNLKQELETVRKEQAETQEKINEYLAKITDLETEVKKLKGANEYLRSEEKKWRYKVKGLEKTLVSAPKFQAALDNFNASWALRGLDSDKAIFISYNGDLREVKAGDQIGDITIQKISFSKKQVETNVGIIPYQ